MGLIRLFLLFLLGYMVFRLLKYIFLPKKEDKEVRGESRPNKKNRYKNIEDADYEEIE